MVGVIHLDQLLVGHTAPTLPQSSKQLERSIPRNLPAWKSKGCGSGIPTMEHPAGHGTSDTQGGQSPPWESVEMGREEHNLSYQREWAGDGNKLEPPPPHPPWVWVLLPGMGCMSGSGGVIPIPKMLRRKVRRKGFKAVGNFWFSHFDFSWFFPLFALNQNPWNSSKVNSHQALGHPS